jgi:hypothetical protein
LTFEVNRVDNVEVSQDKQAIENPITDDYKRELIP